MRPSFIRSRSSDPLMFAFARPTFCLIVGLFVSVSDPSRALAGIPIVWSTGESIGHIGDAGTVQDVPLHKVGFKYWSFSILFMDVWTSGGTYCLYEGDRYIELSPTEASEVMGTPGVLANPWWYSFPLGWIAIAGLVAFVFGKSLLNHGKETRAVERFQSHQTDYESAVQQMYRELQTKQSAAEQASEGDELQATLAKEAAFREAFDNAVTTLVDRGIPREEAAANLAAILQSMGSKEDQANQPA